MSPPSATGSKGSSVMLTDMTNTIMNTTDLYNDYDYNTTMGPCISIAFLTNDIPILPVLLYLLSAIGLIGNTTVLRVLLRYMKLKSITDVCLLNLALSDLIVTLSLPLWAYNFQHTTVDGLCKLMTAAYQLGFYSGTIFVTLMSVDRYLAIVHAVAAMRVRTLRCATAVSVTIWVVSIAMAIPQVVFATVVLEEDNRQICDHLYPEGEETLWKNLRNFRENIVGLLISLPIMVFCYVRILSVLLKSRNSKRKRAMKLVLLIVCVFIICWVPYNVVVFLKTLQTFNILHSCEASNVISLILEVAEILALAHCCVNPVIYAFVGEKFRRFLWSAVKRYAMFKHLGEQTITSSNRLSDNETSNTPL